MMKSLISYFSLFIFSLVLGALTAQAEQLILTGKAADLARAKSALGSRYRVDGIFNTAEKNILNRLGKSDLAGALLVRSKSKPVAGEMRLTEAVSLRLRQKHLPLKVESDQKVKLKSVGTDPLMADLWAIKNTEKTYKLYLDNFSSIAVKGVAGEDVNLPRHSNEGKGTIVAILDSGFDVDHPDLAGQFVSKKGECENLAKYQACLAKAERESKPKTACNEEFMKLDTDGNGYPMDCHGWNFIGKKSKISNQFGDPLLYEEIPEGSTGHGTKVAGIVAAASQNGVGVRGIAPQAKILGVRVTKEAPGEDAEGAASEEQTLSLISSVVRGMIYAIGEKATVINLSLGWNGRADSQLMRDAVKTAQDQGIIVVAAAANDSTDALVYPCQYDRVVCVASHDPDGKLSEFSNFGSGVDIAAPGFSILSTIQKDQDPIFFTDRQGYDFDNGTSFASPYTAGALAVLRSQGLSADESIARLLVGARKKPYSQGKVTLAGNLDVTGALNATPRPYFVPTNKGVYPMIWDRKTNEAVLGIELRNIWKTATKTSLRLSLSERDQKLGQLKIAKPLAIVNNWKAGEVRSLQTILKILDPKITSDATLVLEVTADGKPVQSIRIQLQISVVLDKNALLPNAIKLPIRGIINPNGKLFTIQSLDGKPEQDYVSYELADDQWKIQIVREVKSSTGSYYVAGAIKTIEAPNDGSPRTSQRLDVNLDGKPDYVFSMYMPPEGEEDKLPYFRFDYRNENGEEVLPSYTFKNRTAIITLDRFQWTRSGDRMVQIWAGAGTQPKAEVSTKYDPWHPKLEGEEEDLESRLYYHDPATEDGVRSVPLPKNAGLTEDAVIMGLLNQSATDRKLGRIAFMISETGDYITKAYVGEISKASDTPKLFEIQSDAYRNLRSVESTKTFSLNVSTPFTATAFAGSSGLNSQRISSIVKAGDRYIQLDQTVTPANSADTALKTIAAYADTASSKIAAFIQGTYELLYKDTTSNQVFSTSLRRYTFLPTALYELSFLGAVSETDGVRLPAIQIPDGFGAYPGAEVITPIRRNGVSVDLIRPAALRIQMGSEDCDWLSKVEPTEAAPSQAVYFCGDRFIRVPYRF